MGIVDLIYPKMCVGCGHEGKYICEVCQKKLIKPEVICPMCCKSSIDGWTHPRCRRPDGMERLIVGLPYKGVVQQCLKKVKYKSAWEIIGFLYELGKFPKIEMGVVTSVPMWRDKEQKRGFNQADLVAKCLIQSLSGDSRKVEILARSRETKPMFGLKKKERQENIEGAFRVAHKGTNIKMYESLVILVDDVWTTGATMRECAKTLRQSGVIEVWGLTLAR